MIRLVVQLCLATAPNCENPRVLEYILAENVTPFQCVVRAQEHVVAELGGAAAQWTIKRYTCKPEGTET